MPRPFFVKQLLLKNPESVGRVDITSIYNASSYVCVYVSAKTSNRNILLDISRSFTLNLMKITELVVGNMVYILESLNKNYVIIMT